MEHFSIRVYIFVIVCLYKNIEAAAATLDCDFETDFCSWRNDNLVDLKWTRVPYFNENGYHIYFNTSMNNRGKKSRLLSPMQLPGQSCLTFWYSMYGRDTVALNVYSAINGNKNVIFTKSNNIDTIDWRKAVINVKTTEWYQIVLKGVIGDGNYGDIAIDDIFLKSGHCIETFYETCSRKSCQTHDCDFDDDFCNWMQYDEDDFDWKRQKGKTQTSNTGPYADHKSGYGYYIYIESSDKNRHDTAMILSPILDPGKYCVSFWCYMYGSGIDTLRLQLWHANGSIFKMSTIKTGLGQRWLQKIIYVSSRDVFKIAFEGRVQDARKSIRSKGDIAIDDVKLFSCHDCNDPTPNHGLANSTKYEYGSVVSIQCDNGYTLKGDSVVVCESMGHWNGNASCTPHDCGNLTIQNGTFITPNGTTFGQVGRQDCNAEFDLIGEQNISSTVNGWSNTSAYCKIVDCENLTIQNGTFITPNGTTFGKVGRQECDTGFDLIGERSIRCTDNGWSNTSAYCKIIDCRNLTIQDGTFITPEGTTFGKVGRQVCDTGFDLIGEKNIRCTENGWSNTSAYCKIVDSEYLETNGSHLFAVYVLPPVVIVLIVAAIITVVYIRRRCPYCIKNLKTVQRSTNTPTESSLNGKSHSNQMYSNGAVQLDDEYATIAEEQNKTDCLDTVYYTKVKKKITNEPDKKHAKDANYSDGEINRNGLKRYDVHNTEELNSRIENYEEQDTYYDHACTGKMNTKTLIRDGYSYIGDLVAEYQHSLNFDKQTDMQENTDYSHIDRVNTNP